MDISKVIEWVDDKVKHNKYMKAGLVTVTILVISIVYIDEVTAAAESIYQRMQLWGVVTKNGGNTDLPMKDAPVSISLPITDVTTNSTTLIDDSAADIGYNENVWATNRDNFTFNKTQHFSSDPSARAGLYFRGDFIDLYYYKSNIGGIMDVYIDNVKQTSIDCGGWLDNTPSYGRMKTYLVPKKKDKHRIMISKARSPKNKKLQIIIDAFGVSTKDNADGLQVVSARPL
jgi:hypothetical protein